jgi:hypothetical protein
VIPVDRNPFLPASIGILILCLSAAPGCCKRWCGTEQKTAQVDNAAETGRAGVAVTAPVPHAETTGASTDNAADSPSPGPVPREIPIGKKPPSNVVPSAEDPR